MSRVVAATVPPAKNTECRGGGKASAMTRSLRSQDRPRRSHRVRYGCWRLLELKKSETTSDAAGQEWLAGGGGMEDSVPVAFYAYDNRHFPSTCTRLHVSHSSLIFTTLQGTFCSPGRGTEVQRGRGTCPRPHSCVNDGLARS